MQPLCYLTTTLRYRVLTPKMDRMRLTIALVVPVFAVACECDKGILGSQATHGSDVFVSVETEWNSGPKDGTYGLTFREQPHTSSRYDFGISGSGYYLVTREEEGSVEGTTLIEPTFNPIIERKGENTLAVLTKGSLFKFFINDIEVDEVVDTTYETGTVGVFLGFKLDIDFCNLSVMELR